MSTVNISPGYIDTFNTINGQILTSNGTVAYWANSSGVFANGQSILVSDLTAGNSTVNVVVNSTAVSINGSSAITQAYYYANYYALPSISF